MNVVLVDNYDSFTYNLVQHLRTIGAAVTVVRNDATDLDGIRALAPSRVVLSPGPGRPEKREDFGVCAELIDELDVPILGVCLGHQGIGWRMGGRVVRAPTIVHGKVDHIEHDGTGLFAGLPPRMPVMRYHSLMVERETLPACLRVTARNGAGLIMAFSHRDRPLHGVQFHPESVGTPDGLRFLANFLEAA